MLFARLDPPNKRIATLNMHLHSQRRIVLFFLAILVGSFSGEAAEIQFQSPVTVRGSVVLLGDLAMIRGVDAVAAERLRRIELFPAPARGRTRTLSDVEVRQLLHLHGIIASDHQFSGVTTIAISPASALPVSGSISPAQGKSSILGGDESALVVVATRPIAPGETLRAIDVALRKPDRLAVNQTTARSVDAVVGLEAGRSFAVDQAIDPRALRKPIFVRRGESIAVIAKAAGVRVRTVARALDDASSGDVIAVESLENRQRYSAVVTGPRQAEVFASGVTVTRLPNTIAPKTPTGKE